MVFIDGSNLYHNLRRIMDEPTKVSIKKLSEFICGHFDLDLIEIRYYNSIPDIEDDKRAYYKHLKFLEDLKKQGMIVNTRKLKKIKKKNIKIEKGIDVMIPVDMVRKTLVENKCECCIIISGDADFIPAMQVLKDCRFEAISSCVKGGHSSELKEGKFRYLILKKDDVEKCLK